MSSLREMANLRETSGIHKLLRRYATRLIAIVAISLTYWPARLPALSQSVRDELSARFAFSTLPLPQLDSAPQRFQRDVHPDLAGINGWISSVGAAVALNDLDHDGLANDICYVDTESDLVIIMPVPGTGARYAPFALMTGGAVTVDRATMAPMGCKPNDMNEDGWLDLLVYYWGRTPIAFLHTMSSLSSPAVLTSDQYVAQAVVAGDERWFTNAATFADLDGDGHLDLIIGNYFPDGAQILDAQATQPSYMQHSMSRAFNGGRNRILRWSNAMQAPQPSVQFTEVADVFDEEIAHGWTLAVGAADLDGDLLPEIYFANDFGPDRLMHNTSQRGQIALVSLHGTKGLTTPSSKVLGHDSFKGMGVDFGDLNGDGWLDIYVSNIASEYSLEESHFAFISTGNVAQMQTGIAPYVDRSEELGLSRSGWGWDARLDDFDNDGMLDAIQATGFVKGSTNRWPELHELAMGNDELLQFPFNWPLVRAGDDLSGHQHNAFFVASADGHYFDIATTVGLGATPVSRGIATADVDGDGDLDLTIANQWETSNFYRNDCPNCGEFLALRLLLPAAGASASTVQAPAIQVIDGYPALTTPRRAAVGAQVKLVLADGRQMVAQVDGGNGHSGARSPVLHFGLGHVSPTEVLKVEVRWRDAAGVPHTSNLELTPGWHTLLLSTAS